MEHSNAERLLSGKRPFSGALQRSRRSQTPRKLPAKRPRSCFVTVRRMGGRHSRWSASFAVHLMQTTVDSLLTGRWLLHYMLNEKRRTALVVLLKQFLLTLLDHFSASNIWPLIDWTAHLCLIFSRRGVWHPLDRSCCGHCLRNTATKLARLPVLVSVPFEWSVIPWRFHVFFVSRKTFSCNVVDYYSGDIARPAFIRKKKR